MPKIMSKLPHLAFEKVEQLFLAHPIHARAHLGRPIDRRVRALDGAESIGVGAAGRAGATGALLCQGWVRERERGCVAVCLADVAATKPGPRDHPRARRETVTGPGQWRCAGNGRVGAGQPGVSGTGIPAAV